MSLWNDLGFSENPYSPRPVPADEVGARLLVGRDSELARLTTYLQSSDTHPTLEGSNGVGKTSLVAVAGFQAKNRWLRGESQQALLPLDDPFQLTPDDSPADFKRRVFFRVAQAFIAYHDALKQRGLEAPIVSDVNRWLNSPILGGVTGGVSAYGIGGITGGRTETASTSPGFVESGFVAAVTGWLRACFPTNSAGGFICTIDNLELLETSQRARQLLEALRDEVPAVRGLRWVLCGARGIVRSSASSPRLQGVLAEPLEVEPIRDDFIGPLIAARLSAFAIDERPTAPVEPEGFVHLYRIGNRNLRNAMKYSEDFSFWSADRDVHQVGSGEKLQLLRTWMADTAARYLADTSGVGNRAWAVFDRLVEKGGSTSPSEYADFGFESNQAMRPHLRALEEANMLESAIDETDSRRKTIGITSRGWIVNYARSSDERI